MERGGRVFGAWDQSDQMKQRGVGVNKSHKRALEIEKDLYIQIVCKHDQRDPMIQTGEETRMSERERGAYQAI